MIRFIFYTLGITILFRKPLRTKPNLFAFLAPLKVEVWVCMAAAYIGISEQIEFFYEIVEPFSLFRLF